MQILFTELNLYIKPTFLLALNNLKEDIAIVNALVIRSCSLLDFISFQESLKLEFLYALDPVTGIEDVNRLLSIFGRRCAQSSIHQYMMLDLLPDERLHRQLNRGKLPQMIDEHLLLFRGCLHYLFNVLSMLWRRLLPEMVDCQVLYELERRYEESSSQVIILVLADIVDLVVSTSQSRHHTLLNSLVGVLHSG